MKAIDTNLVIRFLVNDDDRQTAKVLALFQRTESRGEQLLVSLPVVLETIWVLESSYGCARSVILDALEQLTLTPVFKFEVLERVKEFLRRARDSTLDLDDVLIGLTAQDLGCETTLTFDKKAAKSDLFQRV